MALKEVKRWEDYDEIELPDGSILNMAKLLEDQDRAKAALSHLEPFFASMIGKLHFVYTFHVDTQATDGWNIFVNPKFTDGLTLEGKVFVMAHEIMHCVLDHMRRGRQAGHPNHESNVAADYEVNVTLTDMDLTSEGTIHNIGALFDKKYSGWGYEKIYADHPKDPTRGNQNQSQQQKQAGQSGQNGSGQGGQGSSGGQGRGQGGQGGQGGNQQMSADYKAGWAKAISDWKAGKLKI